MIKRKMAGRYFGTFGFYFIFGVVVLSLIFSSGIVSAASAAPTDIIKRIQLDDSRPPLTKKGSVKEVHEIIAKRKGLYEKS